jgi:integrase|tara:strand:- start:26 stop:1183 length:1158 start_codon:yes stop_codon:yes gene_type:complete
MLRITINGQQVALNVRRRIQAFDWDQKRGLPLVRDPYTRDLDLYLETMRNKAYQAFTELNQEYDDVTAAMVRDYIQGVNGTSSKTIMEIWEQHNSELKKNIGKNCSYTLWQKHNTAKNHFVSFLSDHYRVVDVPVKQVRYEMIRAYKEYLTGEKDLGYNTTMKFLQFTKKITLRAIRAGWLKTDPFDGMKLTLKETDRPYLTEDELNRIEGKSFRIKRLELVKDLFLFACYTGLAYSDVKKLHKAEIEKAPNGMWWIRTRRQKTKERSQIPILAPAMSIIKKYTDLNKLSSEDKILPVLSNQKLNSYLKEVADFVQIDKKLTFHVARHTFATTVTLSNGVPIETVSRMLGHTNLKTTQHYARIVDEKVAQDMFNLTKGGKFQLAR